MQNKKPEHTFVKFAVVGVINTLVGTAIMFGLYNLAGASYWVSSAANYVLASILSYILNKKFTFRHEGDTLQSGLRFALNIALCYFIAYGVAKPAAMWMLSGSSIVVQENAAMFAGMCIFVVLNYLGQKLFVFKCCK
jgi:putative flippase GtrA